MTSFILGWIPGASEVLTAYNLGQESDNVRKFYDTLRGEYTLTTYIFSRKGNWGHGEFEQQYYFGLLLYRNDVELENGEKVQYPYNSNRVFNVPKEMYEYMEYTYLAK